MQFDYGTQASTPDISGEEEGDLDITQSETDSKEDITTTFVNYQEVSQDESDLDNPTGDLSHK